MTPISTRLRVRAAAVFPLVVLSACGGSQSVGNGSPSPSAVGSPSHSTSAGYRVLFTSSTSNGSQIFLYDSASSAPQQLVSLGPDVGTDARFITSQTIAYSEASGTSSKIMKTDLSTHATSNEVTAAGLIPAFAYSHDGAMLAYLVHDPGSNASLHVRRNGKETTLTLNPIPGRGVGRDDEVRLEYAPDDRYLLMVDTFIGNQGQKPETGQFLVLRAADNTVAFLPPSGTSSNATMATWARRSDRLYYRDAIGIRSWDAGTTSVGTVANGLHWYEPAVSPDDRFIAYADLDAQFIPHVKLLDLQSNQSTLIGGAARSHPIVITSETIWDLEEQPCQGECMGGPSQPSGKVFAYSVKAKTESGLPFTDVLTLSGLAVAAR